MEVINIQEFMELWPGLTKLELPAVAGLVMLLVRLYRMDQVQAALPARLRWPKDSIAGYAVVGLLSLVGVLIAALASGLTVKAAMYAALPVALSALLGKLGTKSIGDAVREPQELKLPDISPSRPSSLVVPIDVARLGLNLLVPPPKPPKEIVAD